jgi:hypothetical protein
MNVEIKTKIVPTIKKLEEKRWKYIFNLNKYFLNTRME